MLRFGAPGNARLGGFGAICYAKCVPESPMSASEPSPKAANAEALFSASLAQTDPEIANAIGLELGRQRDEIELIASENYVIRAVLEAQGSVLTNKYAEGLPGKRYYGGC